MTVYERKDNEESKLDHWYGSVSMPSIVLGAITGIVIVTTLYVLSLVK